MSFHCGQRQSGPAGARSNMLARRRSRLAERDPPRPGHAIGVLCIHMDFLVQPAHALWASLDYRRPWLLGPGLLQVGNHGQVLNRVAVIPPCWRACTGTDGHGGASAANSSSAAPSAAPALPASRLVHPAYRSAMTGAHLVQPVLAQMRLPYCMLCRSWIDLHYVPARLVKPYADVMLRLSDVHLETSVSTALHALAAADSAIRSPVEISQCAGCCCGTSCCTTVRAMSIPKSPTYASASITCIEGSARAAPASCITLVFARPRIVRAPVGVIESITALSPCSTQLSPCSTQCWRCATWVTCNSSCHWIYSNAKVPLSWGSWPSAICFANIDRS